MFNKILVPLDGSALAAAALLPASALAKQDHAELILVGVTSPPYVAEIGAYLATMVRCLSADGLLAQAIVTQESPEVESSEAATIAQADLIVMATHGHTGLDVLTHPSIAWRVLAQTGAPVLVTRFTEEEQAAPPVHQLRFMTDITAPILVPLDGSPEAERVLPLAQQIAEEFGNPLVLVCVGEPLLLAEGAGAQDLMPGGSVGWWMDQAERYLQAKQGELTRAGLHAKTITTLGMPAEAILSLAQEHQAGLISMASRGRGWLSRLVLGGVTRSVVNQSAIPILLVRRSVSVPAEEDGIEPALASGVAR